MPVPARSLVVLDRDGVINRDSEQYIRSVDEWLPLPGSLEAIARLNKAGFVVAVVTNQSGVGRGYFSEATLAEIHDAMREQVAAAGGRIDAVYYCPHRPDEGCDCRKPKPLLLERAVREFIARKDRTCYIGDKRSDVAAARAAGVRPVLVGPLASERAGEAEFADVDRFADLPAAADALLRAIGVQR